MIKHLKVIGLYNKMNFDFKFNNELNILTGKKMVSEKRQFSGLFGISSVGILIKLFRLLTLFWFPRTGIKFYSRGMISNVSLYASKVIL